MAENSDKEKAGRLLTDITNSKLGYFTQGKIVKALLGAGADPNWQDDFGKTALFAAGKNYNGAVWRELLKGGAKTDIRDSRGMQPKFTDSYMW